MSMSTTGLHAGVQSTGRAPSFNIGRAKGGYRPAQLQQFSPEQLNLFQQMFSQVSPDSYLSKLANGDDSTYEQLEAPALRQFNSLQGNIASRFSGMGSNGSRRSSGFQNTMNQASSDFAQDLQSQRMGIQRNAIRDLMEMSNSLLQQRPYENFLIKKDPSGWQQFLSNLGLASSNSLGTFGSIFAANKLANLGGNENGSNFRG